jgi:hypothetical protein
MTSQTDHQEQLQLARRLLATVRHAAYATVNEDGSPHNSPLMFIANDDLTRLYIGSYSESQHTRNLVRAGRALAVLFDSFTKGQGGLYVACSQAHECEGEELEEALRVHNAVRARYGSRPIDIAYYRQPKPSQRMYSLRVTKLEVYSAVRGEEGLVMREACVPVTAEQLFAS